MWISVEDRLPEEGHAVFSSFDGFPVFAARWDDGWRVLMTARDKSFGVHGNYGAFTPTHWMPLPPLPEEKA